jgi:hypothetical protein
LQGGESPQWIFARREWLPPGGHIPQWRLEAAAAHHGGFTATPQNPHFRRIPCARIRLGESRGRVETKPGAAVFCLIAVQGIFLMEAGAFL